jgi:hypothetical protein
MTYISNRTQLAFEVLRGLRADWPGRFNREIDAVREMATALISENRDKEAGDAMWQLINSIDREVAPELLGEAEQLVATASYLKSQGLKGLQTMLAKAKEAFGRSDYGDCVRKCLLTIRFGEQTNERARERLSQKMFRQARPLGSRDW